MAHPWGSWITCEETVNGPDVGNDFTGMHNSLLTQKHGHLFEVPFCNIQASSGLTFAIWGPWGGGGF